MKKIILLICMFVSTIAFAAQMKVYTTDGCTYCHHLMNQLHAKHIPFQEVPGGKKYDSFPATEINGHVVYGDNMEEILSYMK